MVIEPRSPDDAQVLALASAQQAELAALEGETHFSFPLRDHVEFLLGVLDGEPVACGALQRLEPTVGEVKRMYVQPEHRGRGLSRQILAAIEDLAVRRGMRTLRLETGKYLPVALNLYMSSGYREIPLFGEYVGRPLSVCFEKDL